MKINKCDLDSDRGIQNSDQDWPTLQSSISQMPHYGSVGSINMKQKKKVIF